MLPLNYKQLDHYFEYHFDHLDREGHMVGWKKTVFSFSRHQLLKYQECYKKVKTYKVAHILSIYSCVDLYKCSNKTIACWSTKIYQIFIHLTHHLLIAFSRWNSSFICGFCGFSFLNAQSHATNNYLQWKEVLWALPTPSEEKVCVYVPMYVYYMIFIL